MKDEKINRLLKWADGQTAPPWSIELSPTLKCNLNCLFCWRHGKNNIDFGNEISLEKYKKIIKEASDIDVREIKIIGGGEPFFRNDTIEIMKNVKLYDMMGYICTNGTRFTSDMINELTDIGWDHIKISLHGARESTHDKLTQVDGSFEKCIKSIEKFREVKKMLKSNNPHIEIGFVLVKDNYHEISEMIDISAELGVNSFFVEPITVYSEIGKRMKPNQSDYETFRDIAKNANLKANEFGIETNLSNFVESRFMEKTGEMIDLIKEDSGDSLDFYSIPCYEPWYRMGIRVDGSVCPCGFFDQGTTDNIKEKSLHDIWYGDYFEKRRYQLLNNDLPHHCKKCCVTLVVNNQRLRNELKKMSRTEH